MAWTTPPTFATGDVITATNLNIIKDDLRYLKGTDGVITLDANLGIVSAASSSARLTLATASGIDGVVVTNATAGRVGLSVNTSNSGHAISASTSSTGFAISASTTGNGEAIRASTAGNGAAIMTSTSTSGYALRVDGSSSGNTMMYLNADSGVYGADFNGAGWNASVGSTSGGTFTGTYIYYGLTNSSFLCTPAGWLRIKKGGTVFAIPLYNAT